MSSEQAVDSGFTRCATVPYDIPFTAGGLVVSDVFWRGCAAVYGVSVYKFSGDEARFVVRGELEHPQDLQACLVRAEKSALELGCSQLATQEKLRADWLDAESVFKANDFAQLDTSLIFECPFQRLAERSKRAVNTLERRNAVPAMASVTSLMEGRDRARAMLDEASVMDGFDFDNRLMWGSKKSVSMTYSQLVWLEKALVGVILVAPTSVDTVYEIPIRFIAPSYRQTWVNTLLIHSCVKYGEVFPVNAIRFNANPDTHHETISLARIAGGRQVATAHRYGKVLSLT